MARPIRWRACAHLPPLVGGLCLLAHPLFSQEFTRLGPLGPLNPADSLDHRNPAVACSAGGPFVATWSVEQFPQGHSIFARLYAFDGSPVSLPILLSPFADGSHHDLPKVARADSGNFVVAWSGFAGAGAGDDVAVRILDASGAPIAAFMANSHPTGEQTHPDVASDAAGNFVVVWHGVGPGDRSGTWFRRFGPSGVPFGPEAELEADKFSAGESPVVAMHRTLGTFVAAWEHRPGTGTDIHARRFDAAGAPDGPIFLANSTTGSDHTGAAIAMDADGDFAILVEGEGQGDDYGILGQLFDAGGSPIGGEFWVNESVAEWHFRPRVAFEPPGSFVVAWTRESAPESSRAYATRFSASGVRSDRPDFPLTADFDPPRLQAVSSLCFDGEDTLRALLTEKISTFADDQIFSQRLAVSLFSNGFDGGDTASWSATLP